MKSIYCVFFYISLAIALCSPNVSTLCGNDEQIEDLKTALIIHESSSTAITALSAVPLTATALTFIQVFSAANFALRLNENLEEIKSSLSKDHKDYRHCSEILEYTETATAAIKSTSLGFSLATLIPGVGMLLATPRIAASISSMVFIRNGLEYWKKSGCQHATIRDCNL